jgi:hypothetical protein
MHLIIMRSDVPKEEESRGKGMMSIFKRVKKGERVVYPSVERIRADKSF